MTQGVVSIVAGIDAGAENIKAVVLSEGGVLCWMDIPVGTESVVQVAQRALSQATEKANIALNDIERIVATGAGRKYISFANHESAMFLCLAKGVDWLLPSTRTVLDLGARKLLVVKCDRGRVVKFASGDRCAAGCGAYLEVVANILGIEVDGMAALSLKSKEHLEIQAICAIFAESEIISLIHMGKKIEDILKGMFRGLARRMYSQLLQVGIEKDVVAVGGAAKNVALITALQELAGCEIIVPDNPNIVGALGAALIAQEEMEV